MIINDNKEALELCECDIEISVAGKKYNGIIDTVEGPGDSDDGNTWVFFYTKEGGLVFKVEEIASIVRLE